MISRKIFGAALILAGVIGAIKYLFDLVEKNTRPKC